MDSDSAHHEKYSKILGEPQLVTSSDVLQEKFKLFGLIEGQAKLNFWLQAKVKPN